MYLAAAGVGTLAVIDYDTVDLSNLQRQLLHMTRDVGRRKIESAGERLRAINSEIRVEVYDSALTPANALDLVRAYDVTVDGSDNFPTRYLTNDACVLTARPYVYGSIFRFEGQVSVFARPGGPCYRCLFPNPPAPELVPSCAEAGVLGVVPGIVGTIQAAEAIKLVLGLGDSLAGRLLLFDAVKMRFREVAVRRDPTCPICGDAPSIRDLQDYEAFCGAPHVAGEAERSGPDEEGFEITVTELSDGLRSGLRPVLLDVRETMEARINGLENALLIPLQELPARLSELSATADYVVYCHHGSRSARAVEILRAAGLRARSLRGGMVAWANEVDTAMLRY